MTWSVEAQGDSQRRHARLREDRLQAAFDLLSDPPDVIASAGWFGEAPGYEGIAEKDKVFEKADIDGVSNFSCSHELAHIMCAYGLSPFPQGQPCYVLLWEGTIGAIYEIDAELTITRLTQPLAEPGHRYTFLYELANDSYSDDSRGYEMSVAGKLMALAGCPVSTIPSDCDELIAAILANRHVWNLAKGDFKESHWRNSGVNSDLHKTQARALTNALYELFFQALRHYCIPGRPLLIVGGCGLNCEWNSRFLGSGLFSDVFIPPCTDDTGISIGCAVAAQHLVTGVAKLEWSVYAGELVRHDTEAPPEWEEHPLQYDLLARLLAKGGVFAWIQGKAEIGPRALGHRSILAAPFSSEMRDRLNTIKFRESYRPIAPICRAEDFSKHFRGSGMNEYMLLFADVLNPELGAVTHLDGTARVQVLSAGSREPIALLLDSFKAVTGAGVLCNTSLNFASCGFINRSSDVFEFVESRNLDGAIIDNTMYLRPRNSDL